MHILPNLAMRRLEPELMDQPELAAERHRHALHGLRRINRISRTDAILWPPLRQMLSAWREAHTPRILDLATGGGDVPLRLWRRIQAAGLRAEMHGCDLSPRAVAHARAAAARAQAQLHFFEHDVLHTGVPQGYDGIMANLFLHHLDDATALALLRSARERAGAILLVNDLLRTRLGLALAYLGPRILTRSEVVSHDALLSVRAAFTLHEVKALARAAGLENARFLRHWPQRFLLAWRRP